DLKVSATKAVVELSNLYQNDNGGTGGDNEQGRWEAFDAAGRLVGSGTLNASTVTYVNEHQGSATIQLSDGGSFQYLVFSSKPYGNPSINAADSSDYFVKGIRYDVAGEAEDEFQYVIRDTDGDRAGATLTINMDTVPAPQPTSASLRLFAVVDGNYVAANEIAEPGTAGGLPTAGTYVVLAVDAAGMPLDTQPGGTVTVGVGGAGDTATRGSDYQASPTITATVGTSFSIAALADTLPEPTEKFTLSLDNNWSLAGQYDTVNYSGQVTTTIVNTGTNLAPEVGSATVHVSDEGLSGGLKDTTGNPDTTDATTVSGTVSFSDANGDPVTLKLEVPTENLSSGGVAVVWEGQGTQLLVGKAAGTEVLRITIDADGNYQVKQSAPVDHPDTGSEDSVTFKVGILASDGKATGSGSLTVTVEDDRPVACELERTLTLGQEQIVVKNLKGGFTNPVFEGGTQQVTQQNTDGDSYTDRLSWGTKASGSPQQSGYTLVDNPQLATAQGMEVSSGTVFKLADFTHNNWAITSNSSELDTVHLRLDLELEFNGSTVAVPVNLDLLLDHNETPNSSNVQSSRDIIKLPQNDIVVNIAGQDYTLRLEGFKDASGQLVKTIYTNEGANNSFGIYASIESTVENDSLSGTVCAKPGADGLGRIAWGDLSNPYGTLQVDAEGGYTFVLNAATKAQLANGGQLTHTFTYQVIDKDGDSVDNTLTINLEGKDIPDVVESASLRLFAVVDGNYVAANEIAEPGTAGGFPTAGTYVVLAVDAAGMPLDTQPGGTVTVGVGGAGDTATRGSDYQASPTITATVGTSFSIAALADTLPEPTEKFTLSLDNNWSLAGQYDTVNYSGQVTTTIVDDDKEPEPVANIPYGISNVLMLVEKASGALVAVKIDDYSGDVKDPSHPAGYIGDIERLYGGEVQAYFIKAGQYFYDSDGQQINPSSEGLSPYLTGGGTTFGGSKVTSIDADQLHWSDPDVDGGVVRVAAAGTEPQALDIDGSFKDVELYGGDGDDRFAGEFDNVSLHGGDGDDTFIFRDFEGGVTVDGGKGSWTDVIEVDMDGGPAASLASGSWTLEVEGEKIVNASAHGFFDTEGKSGVIHTEDGDLSFDNIDKIEW
ncbi:MAG: choice-of-anchor K domain-containing protein, partial [Azonexus sp.]